MFLTHWFHFNYAEPGQPFYKAADWPNVFVDIPLVIGAYLLGRARHITVIESHNALKAAHCEHAAKLDKLLAHMDPDTPGPITDVLDRLDPVSPGGIAVLDGKLDRLVTKPGPVEDLFAKSRSGKAVE